jgi:hypothetical protein
LDRNNKNQFHYYQSKMPAIELRCGC